MLIQRRRVIELIHNGGMSPLIPRYFGPALEHPKILSPEQHKIAVQIEASPPV